MKKQQVFGYLVGIVLTFIFLIYLLLNLDWKILQELLTDLQWKWLVLAFITYFLNILLRALRFKTLIYSRSIHWNELVPISALHNLFMYLMPAKVGDISYVLLAKNRLNIPLIEGTATLLAVRFYDFGIITFLLAGILPFVKDEMPDWIFQSASIFILVCSLGMLVVFAFLKLSASGLRANRVTNPLVIRIINAWNRFIAGLVEIQTNRSTLQLTLITLGIWLCIYTNYYFIARSLGTEISYIHISIISIVMVPLTLLPLQGFANIGTHEIGWMSVLIAFGYPYDTALAIAVGSHFLLLILILLVAGFSYLIYQSQLLDLSRIRQNIKK